MRTLWQDLRYAIRMLAKSPRFTTVAVLSLALGIGANTAVFSAINAVLLRSLPVRNPHELRLIKGVGLNPQMKSYTGIGMSGVPGGLEMGTSFPYPAYRDFRDRGTGFTSLFAFRPKKITAVTRGEASAAVAMLVSGNYFSGYGVEPLIGRPITPQEDRSGSEPVAVITYRWWERYCGLDPSVLGQSITLNQADYTIIGVLPRHYVGPMMGDPADIYVPMSAQPHLEPSRPLDSASRWWVQIMGRLSPDASDAQAQASLAVLFSRVLGESNSTMDQPGIRLEDGSRGQLLIRRQLTKPFLAVACVVALVLLVACANLAGLLLVRGAVRRHEMAVRAALGAGRWQLIRLSLIESLVLSLGGAGLGLMVAGGMKHTLAGFLAMLPEGFHVDLRTDSNVLLFTLAVSLLTAIVFGCLPAMLASRVDPAAGLKNRAALGTPRLAFGKVLVAAQVGLSVLLVVGAGLVIRSFANLASVAPGFDPVNVLLFQVRPEDAGYAGPQCVEIYDRIRAAVAAIPGVRGVTFSSLALISNTTSSEDIEFLGRAGDTGQLHRTDHLCIGEDFFRTMNIPLLLGRDFTVADAAESQPVGIVNEAFVRRFFAGENPLGQAFLIHDG
ncbi:MAG: ABC transporter permease, partial [Phycisphaerales bacterium]